LFWVQSKHAGVGEPAPPLCFLSFRSGASAELAPS
jgi:hypothetical protein